MWQPHRLAQPFLGLACFALLALLVFRVPERNERRVRSTRDPSTELGARPPCKLVPAVARRAPLESQPTLDRAAADLTSGCIESSPHRGRILTAEEITSLADRIVGDRRHWIRTGEVSR